MKWIRVIDELPVIPEGKYAVSIIGASFDPCYHDCCRERGAFKAGYEVNHFLSFFEHKDYLGKPDIYENIYDDVWDYPSDKVTHWMYFPKPPEFDAEVLNPIFKRYHENARPTPPLFYIDAEGNSVIDRTKSFED